MNILSMSDFRASCSGNFINSILALADKAKKYGHKTIFMFPLNDDGSKCSWASYMEGYGYRLIFFDRSASLTEQTEVLMNIIDEFEIDLIHCHFSCMNNVLLWNREIHKKVKILYHDHMDHRPEISFYLQLRKQLKLSKRYREYGLGVISVMKRKHFGYALTKHKWYIPNGITYKRNVEQSLTREECRRKIGLKDGEELCLFLGWDIYLKGMDIAMKAILSLRKKGRKIVLGLPGFDENISDEAVEKIKEVTKIDPRQDGFRFLGAWEDMFALHRAADVFLSASRNDAFSYAVLEAISQNVPVVVSDISGTKWSWRYSKCFKFPNENSDKCAEAIEKALKVRNVSSNCDEITKDYSIDIWCDRVLAVYHEFMNK